MADGVTSTDSYSKIKRLSTEELEKLWNKYFQDRSNKKLRDILIVQYVYLTKFVLGRIKGTLPSTFSVDDITSYGVEGLIDAIEKFSPEKGARFETYAIMRIRGCIIDKIRSQDWMPRSVRKKIKDVKEAAEALRQQLGRPATSTEIGEALGIEKEKVDAILAESTSVSSLYDKKGSSDESVEIIDTIEDTNSVNPLEKLEQKDTKKDLQMALKSLPERERLIMVLYYQKNMTLKEIGETIEVSESRVCQLHAQAIMKLKNILSGQKSERMKKSII
ncbi:MAG: FliA/WhiG family RNA polymerase sigma factor [Candidatus Gastranaerophilales bacterium]|nr:FliA/WhiG family RNA polymerase sigma factor [Candidatus Gastranaerophilales bacterium]